MPSHYPYPKPGLEPSTSGADPLTSLIGLGDRLLNTAVHGALGLAAGVIVAQLMRGKHLHWSWAATGFGCVMLMRSLLGGWAMVLSIATLAATVRGRRWHREDLDAGVDLASIAARRRRPLDALGVLSRRIASRWRVRGGAEDWFRGKQLIVGHDSDERAVTIPFGGTAGGTHTLVVGATGSGKTVTQTWMAVRAIEHGMGTVVIDPKGDRDLRGELRRAARSVGRSFLEWTPAGPSVYNPYARGSDTEIADKALAGERFTEPHYLRQAQRYLGHVVRALRKAELEVGLPSIVEHMEPARLELLARGQSEARETYDYLDALTARQRNELAGVRDRLAILAESDVGRWLDPLTADAERFDLLESVRAGSVVYFNIESDRLPLLTQMLGAAIVQDLQTTVAALQGWSQPTLVVIDEFSAIAAEQVVRLFGRARSACCSLLLGTQELSDLRLPGRERLLEQVMGNLSAVIAHRQVVVDSAELIAGLAGTKGAWRASRSGDGRVTRTRIREGRLDVNEVRSLARGWAAVIVLSAGGDVQIARVCSVQRHLRKRGR